MTTEWAAQIEQVSLDAANRGEFQVIVTNRSVDEDVAVVDLVPGEGADHSWFVPAEPDQEKQRRVPGGNGTVTYRYKVAVPAGTAPGQYEVKAMVHSLDGPAEETVSFSNRAMLKVNLVKRPTRWWIPVLIGAVVLATVLGVVGYLGLRPAPEPSGRGKSTPSPAGPDVTGLKGAHVRSNVVAPGQRTDAIATCPAGTAVIGGGYWLRSPVGMVIDGSRPAASGQGWHVHGFNPSTSSLDFDVEAVCGTVRDREVINQSVILQPGQTGEALAACPTGKVSIGGGGSATGLVIDMSRPVTSGQGWQVQARNPTNVFRALTAYAVCATAPSRVVVSASVTVQPTSRWEGGVGCPSDKVSTGGGYVFTPTAGLSLYFSAPSSDKGWDVRAENRTGTNRSVTAYAVCATGSSP